MCSEPFQELSASSTYATHMSVLIPAERQLKNPQSASHCTKSDACMPSANGQNPPRCLEMGFSIMSVMRLTSLCAVLDSLEPVSGKRQCYGNDAIPVSYPNSSAVLTLDQEDTAYELPSYSTYPLQFPGGTMYKVPHNRC